MKTHKIHLYTGWEAFVVPAGTSNPNILNIAAFILILFISDLVCPGSSQGQEFNGGIVAGICGTEISGDRLEGPNKAGIYAGIYVNRYVSERS
ncbi:MAG: hypothetical protein JW861_04745, partial [Bacteroidales bacterium]|nr:hypothetical protein [Bacteroidales bacterium]